MLGVVFWILQLLNICKFEIPKSVILNIFYEVIKYKWLIKWFDDKSSSFAFDRFVSSDEHQPPCGTTLLLDNFQ